MRYDYLGNIATLRNEKINNNNSSMLYITTTHMLPEKKGIDNNLESSLNKSGNLFYPGDILISNIRPYFKKIWFADTSGITSNDVLIFQAREGILKRYLFYILSQNSFFDFATKTSKGTKMPRGDKEALKKFKVLIPEIEYQKKIVQILSSLDHKIEVNNKIIANLEEQAQAIFKSWFVDFDPFQNEEFIESELGMIPKGWGIKSLKEYFPVITGKKNANIAKEDGKYPFFTCSQTVYFTDDYSFNGNAILVAGNGDFNIKRYNGKFEAYQRTYVLIPYNSIYTGFLFYLMKFNLSKIVSGYKGSVINYITKGMIADFKIAVPNNLEEYSILKKFNIIEQKIAQLNKENQTLSELRDALLPKLMSGEIDVSQISVEDEVDES